MVLLTVKYLAHNRGNYRVLFVFLHLFNRQLANLPKLYYYTDTEHKGIILYTYYTDIENFYRCFSVAATCTEAITRAFLFYVKAKYGGMQDMVRHNIYEAVRPTSQ